MMKYIFLSLFFLPLLLSAQEGANGIDGKYTPKGLDIGNKAPNIILKDIFGEKHNLSQTISNKKVVLIFYRGQWCPVCNKHLSNLNDSLSFITAKNAAVWVISPETTKNAEKTSNKTNANFVILSDTTNKTMMNYDVSFFVTKKYQRMIKGLLLTDIAKNNSQEEAQLPVPATYIINENGEIIFKQFDFDYHNRASVHSIIKALD